MINITALKRGGEIYHYVDFNRIIKSIEDQQMHFNFIDVSLMYYGHQHILAFMWPSSGWLLWEQE